MKKEKQFTETRWAYLTQGLLAVVKMTLDLVVSIGGAEGMESCC